MDPTECPFCGKAPTFYTDDAHKDFFLLYNCRGCQLPKHKTLYRVLYDKHDLTLLSISVEVDPYYLVYKFVDHQTHNTDYSTTIFKDIIGVLNFDADPRPLTFKKPVCSVDYVIQLPFDDIPLVLRKLDVYTVLS